MAKITMKIKKIILSLTLLTGILPRQLVET